MKSVKKIDSVGRIVIPAEIRIALGWNLGDNVNLEVKDNQLIVCKNKKECIFCGRTNVRLLEYNNITYCEDCISDISQHLDVAGVKING